MGFQKCSAFRFTQGVQLVHVAAQYDETNSADLRRSMPRVGKRLENDVVSLPCAQAKRARPRGRLREVPSVEGERLGADDVHDGELMWTGVMGRDRHGVRVNDADLLHELAQHALVRVRRCGGVEGRRAEVLPLVADLHRVGIEKGAVVEAHVLSQKERGGEAIGALLPPFCERR